MQEAFKRAEPSVKGFMLKQTREKDLALFLNIAREKGQSQPEEIPLKIVVPAFVISELKTAFEIGFLIYLPFLVIDMVVSSILLSMGMMMLPPVLISLPFKLLLFVLVDGWNLIIGSIVRSFQ
jgi:flagellar biosynthetic protein FliP